MSAVQKLLSEKIPIGDLPALTGRSQGTIKRWIREKRIRTFKIIGRRYTTEADIRRAIENSTPGESPFAPNETPRQRSRRRERQIEEAKKFLVEEGV
jgi:hypothetical protein